MTEQTTDGSPLTVDVNVIMVTMVTAISQEELAELNLQKLFLRHLKMKTTEEEQLSEN